MQNQELVIGTTRCVVVGKSKFERQSSALDGASGAVRTFAATLGGKIGKLANAENRVLSIEGIAREIVRTKKYGEFCRAESLRLGKSVVINSRAAFEAYGDVIQGAIEDACAGDNEGYRVSKKGVETPTAAHAEALDRMAFYNEVRRVVAELFEVERKAREALAAPAAQ